MLTDTHCHIHEPSYPEPEKALARAREAGVERLICVGTDEITSAQAVKFAQEHDNVWASIGLHPHDAASGLPAINKLNAILHDSCLMTPDSPLIAIGESGLDYFYDHSPPDVQQDMLHAQIELAISANVPMIFHVREAFDDFWSIYDQYPTIRGVLHSFTDTTKNLEKALERDLYIGINGISTFTKSAEQTAMFASVPLNRMLFETDAPYLTPVPMRGTINEPAFVVYVARYIAALQSVEFDEIAAVTSHNATQLFSLNTNIS